MSGLIAGHLTRTNKSGRGQVMELGRGAACLAAPRRRGCTVAGVRVDHESRIKWTTVSGYYGISGH
jgi:hypothetical protein